MTPTAPKPLRCRCKALAAAGLLACALLLAGCGSLRLVYGLSPDLAYRWLDGYLDFSDEQSTLVTGQLEAFFQWHRAKQLPAYANFMVVLQTHAARPKVTPEQVCGWLGEALGQLQPSIDHALPMAVKTVQSLTPRELQNLERKYGKVNAEFRDTYLQPDPQARLKASVKRAVDRAESFYGDLDAAQTDRLAQGIAASPFDPEAWLAERQRRQQDTLQALRQLVDTRAPDAVVDATLRRLVNEVQRSSTPRYRAYQERLRLHNCALAAQLHNSASAEQREALATKFKDWETDFRRLAAAR